MFTPYAFASENAGSIPNIAERVQALDKQLYTGKDAIKVAPQDMAVMTKASEGLAAAMPSPGLKIGARAPNFLLKNAQGENSQIKRHAKERASYPSVLSGGLVSLL